MTAEQCSVELVRASRGELCCLPSSLGTLGLLGGDVEEAGLGRSHGRVH